MPTPTVSFRKIPTFVTQRQRAGQKALAKGRELGHRSENSRGGVFGPELYPPRPRWLTRIFTPSMFTRSLRLFVSRPSATGYLPPFDDFRKPPSERLLCSETCHLIIRTTIVRFGSHPAVPSPGAVEAFGRTARDIGQSTLFRPKPSSEGLLTECHLGVRAAQVPQKLSPFPRHARVGKEPRISLHAAETRASAGFLASREPLQGREFSPR